MRALLTLFAFVLVSFAQAPFSSTQAKPSQGPPATNDSLGRSTPRGTITGFLKAAQEEHYETAVEYLDLGERPSTATRKNALKVASELKTILDRRGLVQLNEISDKPEGRLDDDLAPDREIVGSIAADSGAFDIVLQRVTRGKNPAIWLISADTLRSVPAAYAQLGVPLLESYLPKAFAERKFLGIALWAWLAVIVTIPLSLGIAWMILRLVILPLRPLTKRARGQLGSKLLEIVPGPALILITVMLTHTALLVLGVPLLLRQLINTLEIAASITAITWLALRFIDMAGGYARERLIAEKRTGAITIVPLGVRLVKVFAIALALLALLDNLGFDSKAVLAGLGVGGIAIALGAQKSLENLFGGFVIILDQPVRVGDFCRYGDKFGTVEEIGLRSTRLRTPDRTRVFVPNGTFSTLNLENFGPREKFMFNPNIELRYETTPDQLRYVLVEIRKILYGHPKVETEGARARLVGFGACSLTVEIFCYILTPDFNEFAAIREDLLLRIMEMISASGTSLALPSRTLYLTRDQGLNQERAREAHEDVQRWREEHRLPFPDHTPQEIAVMRGRLPYPPPGSPLAAAGDGSESE